MVLPKDVVLGSVEELPEEARKHSATRAAIRDYQTASADAVEDN